MPVPDAISVGLAMLTHGGSNTSPLHIVNTQFALSQVRRCLKPVSELLRLHSKYMATCSSTHDQESVLQEVIDSAPQFLSTLTLPVWMISKAMLEHLDSEEWVDGFGDPNNSDSDVDRLSNCEEDGDATLLVISEQDIIFDMDAFENKHDKGQPLKGSSWDKEVDGFIACNAESDEEGWCTE